MKTKLDVERLKNASRILRCIAHPDRLRLVECLEPKELSVGDIVKKLGLGQAVVSKHLAVLKDTGVVRGRAQKNFRYYSIADKNALNVIGCMRQHGG